ncbi:MAG: uroporphyrinogen decarboxylase [Gemmatimonadaceae bacterium]
MTRAETVAVRLSGGGASLFARAARREDVDCTPVWFMRQAGRILREYRAVRERFTLVEICRQSELCAEVTLQPLGRMPLDAAVLFSDIMLPLIAVGVDVEIVDGVGPVVREPVRDATAVRRVRPLEPDEDLPYVAETIRLLARELHPQRAVLGFAGAPFTLASYLIEGKSSRDFVRTKGMMYGAPALWHELMGRLTNITVAALRAQVRAGADAFQLFDSWVGALSPADYAEFVQPHVRRIFSELVPERVPMVHFGVNTAGLLDLMKNDGATIIGLDWRVSLDDAWERVGHHLGVQGNLDPAALCGPRHTLEQRARDVLERAASRPGHIFNLGHGLHPDTPVENVMHLVDFVHNESVRLRLPAPGPAVARQ